MPKLVHSSLSTAVTLVSAVSLVNTVPFIFHYPGFSFLGPMCCPPAFTSINSVNSQNSLAGWDLLSAHLPGEDVEAHGDVLTNYYEAKTELQFRSERPPNPFRFPLHQISCGTKSGK